MLTRSTKLFGLILILGVFLAGCQGREDASNWCGDKSLRSEDVVVLSTDFGSSTVDVLRPECSGRWEGLLVGGGDLALRLGRERLYVLDRATNGSLTSIRFNGMVEWQTPLDGCGAHDLVELSSELAVLSCYDDAVMRLVELAEGEVSLGPSLAVFADDDGLPEMDRAFYEPPFLFVTLQRLNRQDGFQPTAPGLIVRTRLEFPAAGELSIGAWDTLEVEGLENPVTELSLDDGVMRVGFAGNWRSDSSAAGLAEFRREPFELIRTQSTVESRMWQLAGPWWIGSVSPPQSLEITSMELHRGAVEDGAYWQTPGFSVGGLARASDGGVFVAFRPVADSPAVLRFDEEGQLQARFDWPYLPWELAVVP